MASLYQKTSKTSIWNPPNSFILISIPSPKTSLNSMPLPPHHGMKDLGHALRVTSLTERVGEMIFYSTRIVLKTFLNEKWSPFLLIVCYKFFRLELFQNVSISSSSPFRASDCSLCFTTVVLSFQQKWNFVETTQFPPFWFTSVCLIELLKYQNHVWHVSLDYPTSNQELTPENWWFEDYVQVLLLLVQGRVYLFYIYLYIISS